MKILFQGDSVTDCSRKYDDPEDLGLGYVKYTAEALKEKFPDMTFVNRGISGNRTKDVLARAQKDIVEIDPDIITILIGVNDTWRRFDMNDPTTAEEFRDNYEKILKIVKEKTHAKIDETRKLAAIYADKFIALDGLLAQEYIGAGTREPAEISADGVHPAEEGKKIIASYLAAAIAELAK